MESHDQPDPSASTASASDAGSACELGSSAQEQQEVLLRSFKVIILCLFDLDNNLGSMNVSHVLLL